jgi:hypothetical protein
MENQQETQQWRVGPETTMYFSMEAAVSYFFTKIADSFNLAYPLKTDILDGEGICLNVVEVQDDGWARSIKPTHSMDVLTGCRRAFKNVEI